MVAPWRRSTPVYSCMESGRTPPAERARPAATEATGERGEHAQDRPHLVPPPAHLGREPPDGQRGEGEHRLGGRQPRMSVRHREGEDEEPPVRDQREGDEPVSQAAAGQDRHQRRQHQQPVGAHDRRPVLGEAVVELEGEGRAEQGDAEGDERSGREQHRHQSEGGQAGGEERVDGRGHPEADGHRGAGRQRLERRRAGEALGDERSGHRTAGRGSAPRRSGPRSPPAAPQPSPRAPAPWWRRTRPPRARHRPPRR